ncbi:MAG: NAD(P)-dependent alcohol dehydrogenase [Actinomycetota bacterium]
MRALTMTYPSRISGPPERRLLDVDDPVPNSGEVVVRVHYAALSAIDLENSHGKHRLRNQLTLRSTPVVSGIEMAGVVETSGGRLAAGDRVVGYTDIARGPFFHAERVAIHEESLMALPDDVALDAAASVVGGALPSIAALERIADVQDGARVLITAATGGVGSVAVPLARHLGASVAAVCHSSQEAYARQLGATETYAYDRDELPPSGSGFDVVFDAAAALSFAQARPLLTPSGWYISTMPQRDLGGWLRSKFASQRWGYLLERNADQQRLGRVVELMADGVLSSVIDSSHPFEEFERAFARQHESAKRGKILLDLSQSATS